MRPLDLCPFCGAPAPAPPATTCRYCHSSWARPATVSSPATAAPPPSEPPGATFAGLTFEETLAAAQRLLAPLNNGDVYFSTAIPGRKERSARQVHAGQLPPEEPLVVLHDATVFGSAESGFVLTARRFCWKNSFFNPQVVPWRAVQTATLRRDDSDLELMGNTINCLSEELAVATESLLRELAAEAQRRMNFNFGASTSHAEGILGLVRQHLGALEDLYVAPAIPAKKERNVRQIHGIGPDEQIIAVFDNTVFGSAVEGFVLTDRRFCWKESYEDARTTSWGQLSPGQAILTAPSEGHCEVQGGPLRFIGVDREVVARNLVAFLDAAAEGTRGYR